jgi:very-short-patch-repair endonuclease
MPRRELISDRLREWPPKREWLAPGVVFSHRSAASLHGLDLGLHPLIEITAPYGRAVWPRPGMHIRHARLDDGDTAERQGVPVTSLLRTAFDLARHLAPVEAVAAVDMVLHRRLADLAALEQYVLDRSGWQGVAQARRVVELAEPATESWMESVLRMILIEGGLPRPRVQVKLGSLESSFIARVDMLYEEEGVVIEYDGTNHRDRLVEDNRRQNRLLRAGYVVLRYTAADVHHRPNAIVSEVRGAVELPVSRKRAARDAPGASFRKDF